MSTLELAPLLGLLALGAVHGINPAMGWLFAVALGLQEKKGRAVWRALPPLALGHALSVAAVVMAAALLGRIIPLDLLRWLTAAILFTFGVHRLVRGHRHPRLAGMRVRPHQLTLWSFLMASAHGAGLMVLPLVLRNGTATGAHATHALNAMSDAAHTAHASHAIGDGAHAAHVLNAAGDVAHAGLLHGQSAALAAALVHALGYLGVTAFVAVLVYERLGLRLLRTAWINLDAVWACALIVTALLTPLV